MKKNWKMTQNWPKKIEIERKSWKMSKSEKWRKWENWNEAVWDAIGTARKPEKMFWTAEIELYRWVMSNGPYGFTKIWKRSICFWIFGLKYRRVIVDRWFCDVFVSAEALEVAISVPKIHFWWNFDQKHFFFGFLWFCFLYFSPHPFFDFSDICEFRWKNNFLVMIFIVFVPFCSQNPPRTPYIIY